jgi:hypothetical protein
MTRLSDLPVDGERDVSPHESEILQDYIMLGTESMSVWERIKPAIIATVIFAILSNNWFNSLISQLPFGENPINNLIIRTAIFLIVVMVLIKICD